MNVRQQSTHWLETVLNVEGLFVPKKVLDLAYSATPMLVSCWSLNSIFSKLLPLYCRVLEHLKAKHHLPVQGKRGGKRNWAILIRHLTRHSPMLWPIKKNCLNMIEQGIAIFPVYVLFFLIHNLWLWQWAPHTSYRWWIRLLQIWCQQMAWSKAERNAKSPWTGTERKASWSQKGNQSHFGFCW